MNKKWIMTAAGALIVFIIATFTVLDTKVVEIEARLDSKEIVESIHSDKGSVLIDSFKEVPASIRFVDPQRIEVSGEHKIYGQGIYEIDLRQMQVKKSDTLDVSDKSLYMEILRSDYGLILVKKDGSPGLFHQLSDGTLKRISSNFLVSTAPDVELSASGDKLIYCVRESAQMATYNLNTFKKKVISGTLPEYVLNNFHASIELSPDGGYFMVYKRGDKLSESTLNVYGADSGRKYVDEVMGTSPKWAPDGKRLGFIYSGQLGDKSALTDTRVGYILFPEREVVYFDLVDGQQALSQKLHWSEDGKKLYYMRSALESGKLTLRSFDVDSGLLSGFDLAENITNVPDDIQVSEDMIVMYWEEDKALQIYDLNGSILLPVERIDTIKFFDTQDRPYLISNGHVGYYKDNQICIFSSKARETLIGEAIQEFVFSSDSNWVLTGVPSDGGYNLNVVARKKP